MKGWGEAAPDMSQSNGGFPSRYFQGFALASNNNRFEVGCSQRYTKVYPRAAVQVSFGWGLTFL